MGVFAASGLSWGSLEPAVINIPTGYVDAWRHLPGQIQ